MKTLYFYINGSSSPFWIEEKTDINGNNYYDKLFWPDNASIELQDLWNKIFTIHQTYLNPIDHNFPSLWPQEMCNLFNQLVADFLQLSKKELIDYNIIIKYKNLNQDSRYLHYRLDILKNHLGLNQIINSKNELEAYLKYKQETKSALTTELPFDEITSISQAEYETLNKLILNYESYNEFQISICPYSFRTYIANINIGGHYPSYSVIRINRQDIYSNYEKLIKLAKSLIN